MNTALRIAASLLAATSFMNTALAQGDGRISQKSDELVTPTLATPAERESLALLQLSSGTSIVCSASLLNNEWAVSASHCLDAADVTAPANITLTATWGAAQAVTADRIYRFWGVLGSGMYDIALLHLRAPITVNGSATGYRREITELSLEDMKGKEVHAFGAGRNILARTINGVDVASSTDNQYRAARFTVNAVEPSLFWYPTNAAGETIAGGDSGGPSFESTSGKARIAGVHALCHHECLRPNMCPENNPWPGVSALHECGDAPLSSVAGAVRDIMKQRWNPARAVQTIHVAHSEGQVSKDLMLGNLETLPWDYVRRAAQKFCENRGYVAGYADGQHRPGANYAFKCFGADAGRKHEALSAHLVKVDGQLEHLADTSWVKAARTANDVCKMFDSRFVGGVLTGFEVNEPANAQFVDQRAGLFCLNATNAKWFDASLAELNRPGTDVDQLEDLSWAAAGRAAAQFCRAKLFTIGGFFTGHQRSDRRGVICVGENSATGTALTPGDARAEQRVGSGIEIGPGTSTSTGPAQRAPATEKTTLLRELDALAGRGAGLAGLDPLSAELRNRAAEGPARRGFDIGMAAAEGQTQDGSGKQKIRAALSTAEQEGYDVALSFSLQRNANAARAKIGAAIADADTGVAEARAREPDVFYWLGFDIASGIFGDPARGAQGNTATGPGSLAVRNALSPAAQRGFNASVALHLGRKYR